MYQQARHIYAFGPFRLDAQEVLWRDGHMLPLTPKATEILLILLQNAEHLVDKDVLMRQVWQDCFVEEGNLTKNIFVLRKTLGRTEERRDYIETLSRRGYRFAVQVQKWPAEDQTGDTPTDGWGENSAATRNLEGLAASRGIYPERDPNPSAPAREVQEFSESSNEAVTSARLPVQNDGVSGPSIAGSVRDEKGRCRNSADGIRKWPESGESELSAQRDNIAI